MNKFISTGFQIYVVHAEELKVVIDLHGEEFFVLNNFEEAFQDVSGMPPRRDIDFTIDVVPRAMPMFKPTYRMRTP